jgi:hypothetical protein
VGDYAKRLVAAIDTAFYAAFEVSRIAVSEELRVSRRLILLISQ